MADLSLTDLNGVDICICVECIQGFTIEFDKATEAKVLSLILSVNINWDGLSAIDNGDFAYGNTSQIKARVTQHFISDSIDTSF